MQFRRAIPCVAMAALMASAWANSASAELASGRSRYSDAAFASTAKGDNWIAANLFEQARAANDNPANRFNLAVAYESTGRASEAASLYRDILRTPSARAAPTVIEADRNSDALSVTMANGARLRLARIDAHRFEVGASASAFVGGPSSGRVSNTDARRLDKAARSANGE